MVKPEDRRYAKVYYNDFGWVTKEFKNIRKDDLFMLFNPDNTVVKDDHGHMVFLALEDAQYSKELDEYVVILDRYIGSDVVVEDGHIE